MDGPADVARRRLAVQRWEGEPAASPEDAVRLLLAAQAQEHGFALWAVCARSAPAVAAAEAAVADGRLVRTHVLRPTWHLVHRDDLRWLMTATADRVRRFNGYHDRRHGVDDDAVVIARRVVERVLAERHLTRRELAAEFAAAGVIASGIGLGLIMMRLELGLVVCSGVPRGKQQTYALVDERVPPSAAVSGEEALAELAARYVAGHGPATPKDLAWWASLPITVARRAFDAAGERIERADVAGVEYWTTPGAPAAPPVAVPVAHLVPQYDELTVGYGDGGTRGVINVRGVEAMWGPNRSYHPVLVDGQLVGFWNRTARRAAVEVEVTPVLAVAPDEDAAIDAAIARYGAHLGVPATRV